MVPIVDIYMQKNEIWNFPPSYITFKRKKKWTQTADQNVTAKTRKLLKDICINFCDLGLDNNTF